jgi:hypothetical protein
MVEEHFPPSLFRILDYTYDVIILMESSVITKFEWYGIRSGLSIAVGTRSDGDRLILA